ncbi:TrkH family potassium uptake protein [Shewanella sp. SW36]|uniref:TrkH family potassium uptake protein n=1 Tax=unclassified Shewanella TaxID=196818 RepID=UPI0021DAA467|nr:MULTISPECIES: TrkH family potassium uptake protein [unclassified Shewanella]MCU7974061.1 TrkH family potassium uptake protein [Shewanella sp. SW36]MCU7989671.1 TrkH family potassium uptake protein [Shewanella sp. SW1]MCU8017397.1 TrkH family potassium uptake protein [Shewanella sp. SM72]MCU8050251.1 TrkH family potassium uptake protein [Shewanella sp. SM43]
MIAVNGIQKSSSRFHTIIHLCSFLIVIYSFTMLMPIAVALFYKDGYITPFLITFLLSLFIGVVGWKMTSEENKNLQKRDGFMVACLFWLIFSLMSALPFLLDRRLDLSLTDAMFEGVSGITTTGASIFSDIDELPKSILFYRAQLNFLGGLGIIVLAVAIMPFLGIGGAKLYQSEMPGPMKEEKMTPRLADTARNLWGLYSVLALGCAVAYKLAGMNWFNAICHSLSTVSLGGFSTHSDSLGYYNSAAIELVGGVFSILAAINFALYYIVLVRRSFKPIWYNAEVRFFILILSIVVGIACLELNRTQTFDIKDSLVHGFFQTVSVMTDNGLGSAGYPNWPSHIVLLLLGASFFGGCFGSTCGGIKAVRFLLLYRQGIREIHQLVHPNAILTTKISGQVVSDRVIRSVWGLFFLYIFFTCVFVWGLVAIGHDFATAFGTVAACINNMGIGYGDTASGFGTLKDAAKWLMCVAMLFGRLEIFPVLIIFSRAFWRF